MVNKIHILNGPNLNLLGEREPDIYGSSSLKDIEETLLEFSNKNDIEIVFKQTNHEGELIELIHEAGKIGDGVIINPAGYSHTSIALYDALLSLHIPIIEVHISNIYKREKFRHSSYVSMAANSVISGLGIDGYIIALENMVKNLNNNKKWRFNASDFDEGLIISLSKLLDQTGLSEIEIENKKVGRIKVAKNITQSYSAPIQNTTNQIDTIENKPSETTEDNKNAILSPMVGTIYLKPDPDSSNFVIEGDKVKEGQTLLIVEAMKTMNNIVAERDGVVKKILVKNEQPIQFGDPLVIIE